MMMAGAGYVEETLQHELSHVVKHLAGLGNVSVPVKGTKTKKVCTPAFGPHAYDTKLNGPVWVIGLPLFYEYQVGYDLTTTPPGIGFSEEKCGSCGHPKKKPPITIPLLEEGETAVRQPRFVTGPRRMPNIDVN